MATVKRRETIRTVCIVVPVAAATEIESDSTGKRWGMKILLRNEKYAGRTGPATIRLG
jgi:hypothetical protein